MLEALLLSHLLLFTLVLARISALVMTAPIFGSQTVPVRVRAFLAVAISLVITPSLWGRSLARPTSTIDYGLLIGSELLVGLALGLGVLILFSGVQVAGQFLGQMSGMALADVFDPSFDSNASIFSTVLFYVTMAVFVLIGGHRLVLGTLLDTFAALPPGDATLGQSVSEALVALTQQSFSVGIRATAPVITALLLATLVMGLISRTLPQLNILSFGFGLNSLILLATLLFSLSGVAWAFQHQVEPALDLLLESVARQPVT